MHWFLRIWVGIAACGLLSVQATAADSIEEQAEVEIVAEVVDQAQVGEQAEVEIEAEAGEEGVATERRRVVVIPVRDQIAQPVFYVIRRGLKDAIDQGATAVVLDMHTPGGSLGVTLEIMEALDRFSGLTMTYINNEAISAGAIISTITDEIYFTPDGIIGAAAAVSGGGQEIPETMQLKINSYLRAKVRAVSEGKEHRGRVISAMIDKDYELEIDGEMIKPKGELLTLTASEASRPFGENEAPLLAAGIYKTIEDLLDARFGEGNYEVVTLEVTWSEKLASWLTTVAPLLMGLGMLGIFIEFKTPGFGVFGVVGGFFMALVFFGHHAAGLSGHEAALLFGVGVLLVLIELLFFPGTLVAALLGLTLMLGSLVWSMIDYWPSEGFEFSTEVLLSPLMNVALALVISLVLGVVFARFLPSGWVWDKLVLQGEVGGLLSATEIEARVHSGPEGKVGVVTSALRPAGQVEVEGRRFEARVQVGSAEVGDRVRVERREGFELVVRKEAA